LEPYWASTTILMNIQAFVQAVIVFGLFKILGLSKFTLCKSFNEACKLLRSRTNQSRAFEPEPDLSFSQHSSSDVTSPTKRENVPRFANLVGSSFKKDLEVGIEHRNIFFWTWLSLAFRRTDLWSTFANGGKNQKRLRIRKYGCYREPVLNLIKLLKCSHLSLYQYSIKQYH